MLAGVDEAAAADLRRRDQQVAGHRIVAIEALARFDPRAARGKHLGEAPDRDDAQPLAGREELPVAQGIAEGGIGDVVGGQGELADRQQRLAFRQRLRGGQVARTQGGGGELATLDHDFGDAGHGRFLRLRPCSRPDRRQAPAHFLAEGLEAAHGADHHFEVDDPAVVVEANHVDAFQFAFADPRAELQHHAAAVGAGQLAVIGEILEDREHGIQDHRDHRRAGIRLVRHRRAEHGVGMQQARQPGEVAAGDQPVPFGEGGGGVGFERQAGHTVAPLAGAGLYPRGGRGPAAGRSLTIGRGKGLAQ